MLAGVYNFSASLLRNSCEKQTKDKQQGSFTEHR